MEKILEKSAVAQLVKKCSASYGTQKLITVCTIPPPPSPTLRQINLMNVLPAWEDDAKFGIFS
jgi:hypothetical protein